MSESCPSSIATKGQRSPVDKNNRKRRSRLNLITN